MNCPHDSANKTRWMDGRTHGRMEGRPVFPCPSQRVTQGTKSHVYTLWWQYVYNGKFSNSFGTHKYWMHACTNKIIYYSVCLYGNYLLCKNLFDTCMHIPPKNMCQNYPFFVIYYRNINLCNLSTVKPLWMFIIFERL